MPFFSRGVMHGTSRHPTSIVKTNGLLTVIPFVTPASPFVPQPPHRQLLPPAPPLSTSTSSNTTRASPFSSPPPPHSTSVSPISHPPLAQDLAVALQQQVPQRQSPHDPSHPSARSSPHPSLPSGLSHPHPGPLPLRPSPPHHNNHNNPSHTHPYFLPQHPQAHISDNDPQQLFVQGPLPPHTTTHHQGLPAPAVSLQELEHYQAWVRLEGQNYPYGLPSELDGSAAGSSPYADSAAAMEVAAARMQEEQMSRRRPADTTPRFPSTHPQQAGQRRTPPNPQQQQQLSGTHLGRQTLASDLTLDPTTTMAHVNAANGSAAEMHLAAQLAAAGASTTTGPSLGPSLDGSPSWNSAMTHLQMQQQLEHLYHYQAQQQQAAARQQQQQQQAHSRGPPHRPDSSHPPRNSHSSIGPASAPLPHRQQLAQNPHLAAQAHHYSLELHRQQQEQLRQRLQQREETAERERRNSEEEFLMRQQQQQFAVYGSGGPLSGSPHPMGAVASAGPGAYFPQQAGPQDSNSFQDGLSRARHPSHPHPQPLHAHSGPHHPQVMAHLAHQVILDAAGFPLTDGVGPDPLELAVGVLGAEASPAGMIKYESPLPLE